MSQPTLIQGEQIKLVVINIEHIDKYLKWENDPIIRKYQYKDIPITLEIMKKKYFSDVRDEKKIIFEIWYKKEKIPIGLVDVHKIHCKRAEIYICIGEPEYWGKGIGTEAVGLMLNHGFNTLNYRKIVARVNTCNIQSLKIFNKFGFIEKKRQLRKKRIYIDGKRTIIKVLVKLKKDFRVINKLDANYILSQTF